MQQLSNYSGQHPLTGAMRVAFAAQGMTAPLINEGGGSLTGLPTGSPTGSPAGTATGSPDGSPLSETMLLGIGGGLGIGYILFQFGKSGFPIVVVAFRNRFQYNVDYARNLCERLAITPKIYESSGEKGAAAALERAVLDGLPMVVWVDNAHFPHHALPDRMKGYNSYQVAVVGKDGDDFLVADRATDVWRVPASIMVRARAQVPSDKNRLMTFDLPAHDIDLPAAIRAGIADHVENLSRDSESFSLPALKKWAKMVVDRKNPKGWHVAFASRKRLYDTLRSVYEGIRFNGTEGAGLRGMYAEFLDHSAGILGVTGLRDAAHAYRRAARQWDELANCVLPSSVPAFQTTRDELTAFYMAQKVNQYEALRASADRLDAIREEAEASFPMSDSDVDNLFESIRAGLMSAYDCEVAALNTLKDVRL